MLPCFAYSRTKAIGLMQEGNNENDIVCTTSSILWN